MLAHRNTGAPFTRDDGSRWKRGEVNVPTDEELRRKAYKLRALPDTSRIFLHEHPPAPRTPSGVEAPEANKFPGWPLEMAPERYLELYPKGSNSELAHQVLGTESGKGNDTEVVGDHEGQTGGVDAEEASNGDEDD